MSDKAKFFNFIVALGIRNLGIKSLGVKHTIAMKQQRTGIK